jgi:hypothetical protein
VFNVKRRQLLLTDAPRVIYIDPATRKEMGRITFDIVVKAVGKDASHFVIQTVRASLPGSTALRCWWCWAPRCSPTRPPL